MYRTSNPILTSDLHHFLLDLREKHHHIFAMLAHMPLLTFRILADDEVNNIRPMTIETFFKRSDCYHPKYTFFSIKYRTYLFREDWHEINVDMNEYEIPFKGEIQATCESPQQLDEIVENFEGILAYYMRETLFEGNVFNLHPVVCKGFGITPEDLEILHPMASNCHGRIIKELAEDYLRLGKILGAPKIQDF